MNEKINTWKEIHRLEQELIVLRKRLEFRCNSQNLREEVHLQPVGDGWASEVTAVLSDGRWIAVGLVRLTTVGETTNIDDLVVYSPFRRLGLGQSILKALEAVARDCGTKTLSWRFDVEDMPYREAQSAFLSKAGFTVGPAEAVVAVA